MSHLLVVEDEPGCRESLREIFFRTHQISMAENAAVAIQELSKHRVDLILLDIVLPDRDGLTLLKEIKEHYPEIPVIMVSASGAVRPVVQAIQGGAYDYISKPFEVSELRLTVERALQSSSLQRRVEILEGEISTEFPVHGIIGEAPCFKKALDDIRKAAECKTTVLLRGESGTGKELAARLLHSLGENRKEPFIAVHCAALPEMLMESELFGHEKGAFTNANSQKLGRFDLAGSGTVFFDEVGEMPTTTQVKLLRVLQEREYMRVGGTKVIRTEARMIAATSRDLHAEVAAGRFREDLFYRLNVIPIELPPLRKRAEDIPLLIDYFLQYFKTRIPMAICRFDKEVVRILKFHSWPGNVRELRNLIERILVLQGRKSVITPQELAEEFLKNDQKSPVGLKQGGNFSETVELFEQKLIEDALKQAGGVQAHAAKILGTTRRILKYRMDKLNIPTDGSENAVGEAPVEKKPDSFGFQRASTGKMI